jgi:NTP pyrophosphatase (non-canonical NTP hydrolase)
MNKEQHMFLKLSEEAIEIAHMVSKIMQFGMFEAQIGDTLHNTERLHKEMDDYMAVVEILNEQYGLNYSPNRENIEAKKAKLEKYLQYSINLGCVDG